MTIRAVVLAAAVLVVLGGCARSGLPDPSTTSAGPPAGEPPSAAPAPPGPRSGTFGATLEIQTGAGSATYTVGNWRAVPLDAQIIPAKGVMYAVDVRILANSGTVPVNGFFFAARTADGSTIAPTVGAVRPGITYGQLTQGQSAEGHVAFDFAPGTAVSGVVLRDPTGKQLAFWSVS